MQTIYIVAGSAIGLALIYGLARLAMRFPSRSTRREHSSWNDTSHISGTDGGPH